MEGAVQELAQYVLQNNFRDIGGATLRGSCLKDSVWKELMKEVLLRARVEMAEKVR